MSRTTVIHLFSIVRPGIVRYEGEASYLGHHRQPSQDREGNAREAIVFELAVARDPTEKKQVPDLRTRREPSRSAMWTMNLEKLGRIASSGPGPKDDAKERPQKVRRRSEAVKV